MGKIYQTKIAVLLVLMGCGKAPFGELMQTPKEAENQHGPIPISDKSTRGKLPTDGYLQIKPGVYEATFTNMANVVGPCYYAVSVAPEKYLNENEETKNMRVRSFSDEWGQIKINGPVYPTTVVNDHKKGDTVCPPLGKISAIQDYPFSSTTVFTTSTRPYGSEFVCGLWGDTLKVMQGRGSVLALNPFLKEKQNLYEAAGYNIGKFQCNGEETLLYMKNAKQFDVIDKRALIAGVTGPCESKDEECAKDKSLQSKANNISFSLLISDDDLNDPNRISDVQSPRAQSSGAMWVFGGSYRPNDSSDPNERIYLGSPSVRMPIKEIRLEYKPTSTSMHKVVTVYCAENNQCRDSSGKIVLNLIDEKHVSLDLGQGPRSYSAYSY
jgi:hypothetical protein